jgi:hypothetical protein
MSFFNRSTSPKTRVATKYSSIIKSFLSMKLELKALVQTIDDEKVKLEEQMRILKEEETELNSISNSAKYNLSQLQAFLGPEENEVVN